MFGIIILLNWIINCAKNIVILEAWLIVSEIKQNGSWKSNLKVKERKQKRSRSKSNKQNVLPFEFMGWG
jgi:hypothetical protein